MPPGPTTTASPPCCPPRLGSPPPYPCSRSSLVGARAFSMGLLLQPSVAAHTAIASVGPGRSADRSMLPGFRSERHHARVRRILELDPGCLGLEPGHERADLAGGRRVRWQRLL